LKRLRRFEKTKGVCQALSVLGHFRSLAEIDLFLATFHAAPNRHHQWQAQEIILCNINMGNIKQS
jgi:hypothetical protein